MKRLWQSYKPKAKTNNTALGSELIPEHPRKKENNLRASLYRWEEEERQQRHALLDRYEEYITDPLISRIDTKEDDLGVCIRFWKKKQHQWPELTQLAFDALSIPAMSAECERCFSSGRLIISPQRHSLGSEAIEACECQGQWFRRGYI
jgi:hAT family C-terminal dimerisation region